MNLKKKLSSALVVGMAVLISQSQAIGIGPNDLSEVDSPQEFALVVDVDEVTTQIGGKLVSQWVSRHRPSVATMADLIEALHDRGSKGGDTCRDAAVEIAVRQFLSTDIVNQLGETDGLRLTAACLRHMTPTLRRSFSKAAINEIERRIGNRQRIVELTVEDWHWLREVVRYATGSERAMVDLTWEWIEQSGRWKHMQLNDLGHLVRQVFSKFEPKDRIDFEEKIVAVLISRSGRQDVVDFEDDSLDWIARCIRDNKALRRLESHELAKGDGPGYADLQLLAWGFKHQRSLETWIELLDGKLADSSITGDRRARWLLARGYAECLSHPTVSHVSDRGDRWIRRAFQAAESESMRLTCARERVMGLAQLGRFDDARQLAQVYKKKLTSADAQAMVSKWVRVVASHFKSKHDDLREEQRYRNVKSHRTEIERRLTLAREQKDRELIGRYERLIDRMDKNNK